MCVSCLEKRGWNSHRLLRAVNTYIAEVGALLEGNADSLAAGEYERLSGLSMRVATVTAANYAMAIEPPGLAALFHPTYSIIDGAVYVVSVRPGGAHGEGTGQIVGQVGAWQHQPGVRPYMEFGDSTAHPLLPAVAGGPGPNAPQPSVTIFPTGPVGADGERVVPGQDCRLPRYLAELEVGNRGPTAIRQHLYRCFEGVDPHLRGALAIVADVPRRRVLLVEWRRPDGGGDAEVERAWDIGPNPISCRTKTYFFNPAAPHQLLLAGVSRDAWVRHLPGSIPPLVVPGALFSFDTTIPVIIPPMTLDLNLVVEVVLR